MVHERIVKSMARNHWRIVDEYTEEYHNLHKDYMVERKKVFAEYGPGALVPSSAFAHLRWYRERMEEIKFMRESEWAKWSYLQYRVWSLKQPWIRRGHTVRKKLGMKPKSYKPSASYLAWKKKVEAQRAKLLQK